MRDAFDADLAQALQFVEQRLRIDHGAASDEQLDVRIERPRRHDAQRQLAVADDDRVAGVVAAAKPRHDVVVGGVQVDDPSLSLVAPLAADDHVCFRWHRRSFTAYMRTSLRTAAAARIPDADGFSGRLEREGLEGSTTCRVVPQTKVRAAKLVCAGDDRALLVVDRRILLTDDERLNHMRVVTVAGVAQNHLAVRRQRRTRQRGLDNAGLNASSDLLVAKSDVLAVPHRGGRRVDREAASAQRGERLRSFSTAQKVTDSEAWFSATITKFPLSS